MDQITVPNVHSIAPPPIVKPDVPAER
jgi:hypothetical protein